MKFIIQSFFIVFIVFFISLFSCNKMDSTYKEFLKEGETIYVSKPDSVHVANGENRVKFIMFTPPDPTIVKYKIFWNNKKDSTEKIIEDITNKDSIEIIVNNIEEGTQYFSLYLFDKYGHSSLETELIAEVFGELYRNSVIPRPLEINGFTEKGLEVYLGPSEIVSSDLIFSEIKYLNSSWDTIVSVVPPSIEIDTLLGAATDGERLFIRSAFLHDPTAIDTVFSKYVMVEY